MKRNYVIITVILALSVIVLFYRTEKYKSDYREQVNLYNSVTDTLQTYKTKDSLNTAKIQVMQTEKESDFLKIKNLTSTNKELQDLVKAYKKDLSTAIIIKEETVFRDTVREFYPLGGDTLVFSRSVLLDTLNTDWIDAVFGFRKGFSYLDLTVRNRYDITIGYEGKTLFKEGIPYAVITNHNPYTQTKDMRVYNVKMPKPKRFGISVQAGYGVLYDMKINDFGYGPYMGLGLNYNIIRW